MNDALKFRNAFWLCICICICIVFVFVFAFVVSLRLPVSVCVCFECARRPSRHVCPCSRQSALRCESVRVRVRVRVRVCA